MTPDMQQAIINSTVKEFSIEQDVNGRYHWKFRGVESDQDYPVAVPNGFASPLEALIHFTNDVIATFDFCQEDLLEEQPKKQIPPPLQPRKDADDD